MQKHSPLAWTSLILVALMCVLPFLVPHHRNPLTTFYGEWLAAALGLAASALLLRRASWQPFHFPVVALVPIGLMILLGVQVAVGLAVYWQQHFLVGLYLFLAALLIVLGAELRREFGLEKIVPVLAWAVLIGGLLSAFVVGLQISGKNLMPYIVPSKAAGFGANLMQINHLANYLGLALASLLYLVATSRIKVPVAMLLAIALLFPLALTGQRMGWIYVAMLSVGAWLAGRKSARWSWRYLLLIPAFALLQFVIPLLAISGAPLMPTQKLVAGMQGSSVRLQYIYEAWDIFLGNPLMGAGFRQFGWHDLQMATVYPNHQGWSYHAHNIVLQLMAEMGLLGLVVFMGGLFFLLINVKRENLTPDYYWAYAMFMVLGVHSMLEYPLWYMYFLLIFALLLGFAEEKFLKFHIDLGAIVLGAILIFGTFSLTNIAVHEHTLANWYKRGTHPGNSSVANVNRMLDEISIVQKKSLLTPYVDFMLLRILPNKPALLEVKLAIAERVIHFMQDEREVYGYVTLLALDGQEKDAQQLLRKALIRYPQYADTYAMQLFKMGDMRTLPLVVLLIRHTQQKNK